MTTNIAGGVIFLVGLALAIAVGAVIDGWPGGLSMAAAIFIFLGWRLMR